MTTPAMQRQQRAFVAPAVHGQPRINGVSVNAERIGPVRDAFSNAVLGNPPSLSCVAGLFARRAPFTVARLIMPMHVFAVEAVFRGRAIAELCVKLFKRCIEKLDTPAAIRWIGRAGWVCASAMGPIVRFPFRGMSHSVSGVSQNSLFTLPAPAGTDSCWPLKNRRVDDGGVAALTLAPPSRPSVQEVIEAQHQQAPKRTTRKVDESRAGCDGRDDNSIFVAGHSVFSYQKIVRARAVARLILSRRPVFIIPHDLMGGHYIAQ